MDLASKYFSKFSICAPVLMASAIPGVDNGALVLQEVSQRNEGDALNGSRSNRVPLLLPHPRLRDPLLHEEVADRRRAELGSGGVAVAGQPPRQGPGPHLRGLADLGHLAGVGRALLPAGHLVGGSRIGTPRTVALPFSGV